MSRADPNPGWRENIMSSRLKHGLLIVIAVVALFFVAEHGYGATIQYTYDENGNLVGKTIVQTNDTDPPTTTAIPAGGTYWPSLQVALECNDGSGSGCDKTYYSTDGLPPTNLYSSPISISATTTLKFFSKDRAANNEAVKTEIYTISQTGPDTVPPVTTPSPAGGFYALAQSVTLTCADSGGSGCDKIYYGIGGATPTTLYSSPIGITETSTLRFYATDNAGNKEAIKTTVYVIQGTTAPIPPDTTPPTTSAYPPGGIYNSARLVTLVCTDGPGSGCYGIHYTTDGSDPLTSGTSQGYTSPILVSVLTTLKFFARDAAGNAEAVKTELYTIDTSLPMTIATPPAGSYYEPKLVTLSCSDASGYPCQKVYYTTDGTTPTIFSAVYSAPFNISETMTLKFFGEDFAGNTEPVKTAAYIIDALLCPNPLVRIGSTAYTTLQAAYNAAADGNIIQCRNLAFTENLSINRNIAVTLEGGWDCGYTTNAEDKTIIGGSLTITAGRLTLKNFIIGNSLFPTDTTPPTTTATPAGDTYDTSFLVFLACDDGSGTGCDKIYYTTDGTTPLTTSRVYSEPIEISVTTTLKFFARDLAGNREAVKAETYTIASETAAPLTTASPVGGLYSIPPVVTLTCGAGDGSACDKIYYTTDGTIPTISSAVYSSPIPISISTTLNFFGVDFSGNAEKVKSQTYILTTDDLVRIGVTPYMTLQGAYDAAVGGDIIRCRNITFTENLSVDRNIAVTLDGGYDSGFMTNAGCQTTMKGSLTTTPGGGTITMRNFILSSNPSPDTNPPTTTADPPGGAYSSAQSVALTCTDAGESGCDKIYYSTDRSIPTTSWPVYSAPINIPATTTLMYFAKDLAGNREAIKTQTYTIISDTTAPTTTAAPAGGTYESAQSVTLSCNDASGSGCDKIYYTTNGTDPTTSSPVYSSPINISVSTTLKFFAKDRAGNSEAVKTQTYTITTDTTPPITTASPAGGTYSSAQSVTLTCTDSGGSGCDKIYYTTDGSTPTTSSPIYSSPINISVTTTLKFFAKDLAGNSEAVKTQTYTITFTIGETNILSIDDNTGYGNWLTAQRATLGQTGTILSMSFYVKTPSGNLRLGIYDATGPNGGPGALKAQTAGFTPVSGWNTRNVVSQVTLPAGTYWLAFLPSSNYLVMKVATTGSAKRYNYAYGALPATFSTSPTSGTCHWSFYATLQK
jgi:hypothetical protein